MNIRHIRENSSYSRINQSGIGLLETIIAVGVFSIIALSALRAYLGVMDLFNSSALRTVVADLANEQIEILRNMPYTEVGTAGGIPSGPIPQVQTLVRAGDRFVATTTVRNIDDPFDGTLGGVPNDSSPADYKLVELEFQCVTCQETAPLVFTARVAPKALETASGNGALFVQAIDASGGAVAGASVRVINNTVTPAVDVTDETSSDGFLRLIDVKPSAQSYHISVTKTGYTSERTYAPSESNPNPVKLPATVAGGQVTQITFIIDRASTLTINTQTETCVAVPSVDFAITGEKLIGINPNVPKYLVAADSGSGGSWSDTAFEWDNYTFNVADAEYAVRGFVPPELPLYVGPNTSKTLQWIMQAKNSNEFLAYVKDSATNVPLSGAEVNLRKTGFNATTTAARGYLRQTDWSGGSGQANFIDPLRYASDDGGVDAGTAAGEVRLAMVATSTYAGLGALVSSTYDTGSESDFYSITWTPESQQSETGTDSVRFQVATATTTTPSAWTFLGPDGTANSFYTVSSRTIHASHNGDHYLRYKMFLTTASTTYTPRVSDVAIAFASDCVPAGQAFFNGLGYGTYTLTVSYPAYQTFQESAVLDNPWMFKIVSLTAQ